MFKRNKGDQHHFSDQRQRCCCCSQARIWLVGVLVATILFSSVHTGAENDISLEYRVKAAFLLNFCKFVSWPESSFQESNGHLNLCVLGDNPFGEAMDALSGKTVRGRKLRIQYATDTQSMKDCHLLFVSKSMATRKDEIIAQLKRKPIVTVGDMEDFAQRGGMINFFMYNKKIRFEINPVAASIAGIDISSQLLKIAKITASEHDKGN